MPSEDPTPDSATPADLLTPHDQAQPKPAEGVEPESGPGIVDPRHLGPPILDPPPPGLSPPESATKKPAADK